MFSFHRHDALKGCSRPRLSVTDESSCTYLLCDRFDGQRGLITVLACSEGRPTPLLVCEVATYTSSEPSLNTLSRRPRRFLLVGLLSGCVLLRSAHFICLRPDLTWPNADSIPWLFCCRCPSIFFPRFFLSCFFSEKALTQICPRSLSTQHKRPMSKRETKVRVKCQEFISSEDGDRQWYPEHHCFYRYL